MCKFTHRKLIRPRRFLGWWLAVLWQHGKDNEHRGERWGGWREFSKFTVWEDNHLQNTLTDQCIRSWKHDRKEDSFWVCDNSLIIGMYIVQTNTQNPPCWFFIWAKSCSFSNRNVLRFHLMKYHVGAQNSFYLWGLPIWAFIRSKDRY